MSPAAHHHFVEAEILELRPTQMTAGFAEVAVKRREWAALSKKDRKQLLQSHWFPAVLGPRGRHYIVDHHHLGLALHEEGVRSVKLVVLDDLSYLVPTVFWRVMEERNWVHPFDQTGKRRPYTDIPTSITELDDDPHRSLAGMLRTAGGFAKDTSPFAEFLWADYLRPHVSRAQIRKDIGQALREAQGLSRSPLARYLPGWSGVTVPMADLRK
ncbi:MAG: chromosome partitioning protein ParB [Caulobacter sp.]|nr:chromosome partitioning protein ParB [Vitreoscilla sp.]